MNVPLAPALLPVAVHVPLAAVGVNVPVTPSVIVWPSSVTVCEPEICPHVCVPVKLCAGSAMPPTFTVIEPVTFAPVTSNVMVPVTSVFEPSVVVPEIAPSYVPSTSGHALPASWDATAPPLEDDELLLPPLLLLLLDVVIGLGVLPLEEPAGGVSVSPPPLLALLPLDDVADAPLPWPSPPDAVCTGSVLGPVLLLQAAVSEAKQAHAAKTRTGRVVMHRHHRKGCARVGAARTAAKNRAYRGAEVGP